MPINSLPSTTISSPLSAPKRQRFDRLGDGNENRDQRNLPPRENNNPTRNNVERVPVRNIEAILAAQKLDFNDRDENLSPRAQKAIRAFREAGPSPAERLGVEVIGLDTYA